MSDAISLLTMARSHQDQLWTFYLVIVFGILGFTFSDTYRKGEKVNALLFTVAFGIFTLAHMVSLVESHALHNQILAQVKGMSAKDNHQFDAAAIINNITPNTWLDLVWPLPCIIIVFCAMWLPFKNRKTWLKTE
jgi:hypothetical protein